MRLLVFAAAAAVAASLASPAGAAIDPIRWCGNDRAQTDRVRDRAGGPQVHVVYAIPSNGEDRFDALASPLATDVAAIDAWWRREDPARAPRFDLFDFPGCESRFGLLDLSSVRLPGTAAAYSPSTGRFERISSALSEEPYAFDALNKKYLVFYDGDVPDDGVCGTASGAPAIGGAFSYAVIYLRAGCGAAVGRGLGNAYVAAHELLHLLGALPSSSPNECPDSGGHVCDGSTDILWPYYALDDLTGATLDIGRDDYYAHPGAWFDVQSSRWLLDPTAQVPVTIRVVGEGIVGSEPDGQGCTTTCVTEWDAGTAVQLAAEARPGHAFAGWAGACSGTTEESCLLEVGGPAEVVASFRPVRVLTVAVTGRGTVSGAGLRCARTCRSERFEGERVALRAAATRGWRFVRWTGGCRGSRPTCTVGMAASARVGAVFARRS